MFQIAVCLHKVIRICYPGQQNAMLDREDNDHRLVEGQWRQGNPMHEVLNQHGNQGNMEGHVQRDLLQLHFNSPAGSVPRQMEMV